METTPTHPPARHHHPLQSWQLTYSPAHHPTGTPIDPRASRNVLQERRQEIVEAPSADAATGMFERDRGLMVTGCTRVQPGDEVAA